MTTTDNTVSEMSSFRGRGSLVEVVDELRKQIDARVDFVVDTRDLEIAPDENSAGIVLRPSNSNATEFMPRAGFPVLDQALQQIAGRNAAPVPIKFLRNAIDVTADRLCDYLTGCMHDSATRRLVRALDYGDGNAHVRAFLSSRYRVIDSLSVASKALEIAQKANARVLEASVTDSHMRLKFVAPEIWQRIEDVRTTTPPSEWYAGGLGSQTYLSKVSAHSRGDLPNLDDQGGLGTVWPVATIGNSETGHGRYSMRGGVLQACCFNLATVEDVVAVVHLGEQLEAGDIWQEDTVQCEAETIYKKTRDGMLAFFTPAKFAEICDEVRAASTRELRAPNVATSVAIESYDALHDGDLDALVGHFMCGAGNGNTLYSLGQAVARLAQDTDDANRAEDIERAAGSLLTGGTKKFGTKLVAAEKAVVGSF